MKNYSLDNYSETIFFPIISFILWNVSWKVTKTEICEILK